MTLPVLDSLPWIINRVLNETTMFAAQGGAGIPGAHGFVLWRDQWWIWSIIGLCVVFIIIAVLNGYYRHRVRVKGPTKTPWGYVFGTLSVLVICCILGIVIFTASEWWGAGYLNGHNAPNTGRSGSGAGNPGSALAAPNPGRAPITSGPASASGPGKGPVTTTPPMAR
ncbi:MAG: hypothetical protein ACREP6_06295 [Candidatus Binataceae bacterium]